MGHDTPSDIRNLVVFKLMENERGAWTHVERFAYPRHFKRSKELVTDGNREVAGVLADLYIVTRFWCVDVSCHGMYVRTTLDESVCGTFRRVNDDLKEHKHPFVRLRFLRTIFRGLT